MGVAPGGAGVVQPLETIDFYFFIAAVQCRAPPWYTGIMEGNKVRIHFLQCPGSVPELTVTVHRYNVPDELRRLAAWGCRVTRLVVV